MELVGIFHSPLVYFMAVWYSLWLLGIFCGRLAKLFQAIGLKAIPVGDWSTVLVRVK
jgi:hypothetical protein